VSFGKTTMSVDRDSRYIQYKVKVDSSNMYIQT
jgi:hypothetical protein